jgi:hypothetical protein
MEEKSPAFPCRAAYQRMGNGWNENTTSISRPATYVSRCEPLLSTPAERDHKASRDNQRATHVYRSRRRLIEAHLRDHLRDQEEQHNVDADQFPKIPSRNIHRCPIASKYDNSRCQRQYSSRSRSTIESHLKKRIAPRLKKSGNSQNKERANRIRNEPADKTQMIPPQQLQEQSPSCGEASLLRMVTTACFRIRKGIPTDCPPCHIPFICCGQQFRRAVVHQSSRRLKVDFTSPRQSRIREGS